jgi:carbon storage regulator
MLLLTRKVGERVVIGGSVVVEVLEVRGTRVRLGVRTPQGVTVLRQELSRPEGQASLGEANLPLTARG